MAQAAARLKEPEPWLVGRRSRDAGPARARAASARGAPRGGVSRLVGPGPELIRPALDGLVLHEPPAETVQRELGLERVVKLASNEGPFGPFPGGAGRDREVLAESNGTRTAVATGCATRSRGVTVSRSRRSSSRRARTP